MRLLVVYHAGFTYTPAILHYLDAIRQHSAHQVEFFNIDERYDGGVPDFSAYDALFVNFCVASFARSEPSSLPPPLVEGLRRYRGLKIAAVQDEYDFTDFVKRFFADIGVDAVLTN